MPEMAYAGKGHRHSVLIGRGDRLIILYRAARLNYRRHTKFGSFVDVIAKREKCVRRQRRALKREVKSLGTHRRDADRVDAVHLTGTDAERLMFVCKHDRVR